MNIAARKALIVEYYKRVDAQDIDWVLDLFTADSRYVRADADYTDKQAITDFYRNDRKIAGAHSVDRVVAEGDQVLAAGVLKAWVPTAHQRMSVSVISGRYVATRCATVRLTCRWVRITLNTRCSSINEGIGKKFTRTIPLFYQKTPPFPAKRGSVAEIGEALIYGLDGMHSL
jgi:ketosteroid isomerase-like protein